MNQLSRSISILCISLGFIVVCPLLVSASDGHVISHDQLKRGERLFYGLIPMGEGAISCASCHNTRELDTRELESFGL